MARAITNNRKIINTSAAWAIGLLIFFPILWTILTSFKSEAQAINDPPIFFFFDWTLENYGAVVERSNYMKFLWNSVIIAGGSTLIGIIIALVGGLIFALTKYKRVGMGVVIAGVLFTLGTLFMVFLAVNSSM